MRKTWHFRRVALHVTAIPRWYVTGGNLTMMEA